MDSISTITPLIISVLALLGTVSANVIAERSRRASHTAAQKAEEMLNTQKHSEILLEIETQRARLGTFLMVSAQKMLLFQKHSQLLKEYPREYERLENNLKVLQHLLNGYEKQRGAAEAAGTGGSAVHKETILADIKSLTIRLNEEIAKEEKHLAEVQGVVEKANG